jgi:hypothetical protein
MTGYDLGLTRIISQADFTMISLGKKISNSISLLVEGPLDKEFYYKNIGECIKGTFEITQIKKQNSPNILEIAAVSGVIMQIIALFVVTRVKVEFAGKKHDKGRKKKKGEVTPKVQHNINPYQLFPSNSQSSEQDIFQLYLSTSRSVQMQYFEISSIEAGKIRHIIIDIHDKKA